MMSEHYWSLVPIYLPENTMTEKKQFQFCISVGCSTDIHMDICM